MNLLPKALLNSKTVPGHEISLRPPAVLARIPGKAVGFIGWGFVYPLGVMMIDFLFWLNWVNMGLACPPSKGEHVSERVPAHVPLMTRSHVPLEFMKRSCQVLPPA